MNGIINGLQTVLLSLHILVRCTKFQPEFTPLHLQQNLPQFENCCSDIAVHVCGTGMMLEPNYIVDCCPKEPTAFVSERV